MNSWKFNSTANYFLRISIANLLNIHPGDVYKVVQDIQGDEVVLKNGNKLSLTIKTENDAES